MTPPNEKGPRARSSGRRVGWVGIGYPARPANRPLESRRACVVGSGSGSPRASAAGQVWSSPRWKPAAADAVSVVAAAARPRPRRACGRAPPSAALSCTGSSGFCTSGPGGPSGWGLDREVTGGRLVSLDHELLRTDGPAHAHHVRLSGAPSITVDTSQSGTAGRRQVRHRSVPILH
jgi:hypothetical protein